MTIRAVTAGCGKRWRRLVAASLGAMVLLGAGLVPTVAEARRAAVHDAVLGVVRFVELPAEGRAVLAAIRGGGPFAYRRDGIVFGNREGILPRQARGYYAEYTVATPGERTRGARRIIAGRGASGDFRTSDEYYYTNDHYQSFRRIVQ